MQQQQHTLANEVGCRGQGLHSGASVEMKLAPAPAGSGIVFVRTDLGGSEIPARPSSVTAIFRATTLGRGAASVTTVEHLLAALYALRVDNARVELNGPEVPVLDGSAAPFVAILRRVGLKPQASARTRLRVLRRIEVVDGDRRISASPARALRVRYAIDFDHPAIRRQELDLGSLTPERFESELASARTFGFLDEVAALREAGLALGGNLDNTVVLDRERVINRDGLRVEDEFVRHKALDLVGDLALLGSPLEGSIEVERGGHSLHQRLVQALLTEQGACEWVGHETSRRPTGAPIAAAAR